MSELLRFFKDMRDNGYGLAEIAAQLGTSAIAEPVAGFAAMYDPVHGADAIREGMTYTPRTQEAQQYSQSIGNAAKTAIKPAMPIIDTWKKGVDIAGQYSPVVGAGLRTVPAAIGIAMGAKPALQAGRQVSEGLGAMQGRMIANANAPRTLNTGYMGQRGTFAGINALTADKEALAKAQGMIAQGVDPEDVWQETGWGRGADGKWRFEIDDSKAKLRDYQFTPTEAYNNARRDAFVSGDNAMTSRAKSMEQYASMTKNQLKDEYKRTGNEIVDAAINGDIEKAKWLSEQRSGLDALLSQMGSREYGKASSFIAHGDLGEAYPDVYKIHTRISPKEVGNARGHYSRGNDLQSERVVLGEKPIFDSHKSTMLHELQHAIQEREGFAKGGNPNQFEGSPQFRHMKYQRLAGEVEARMVQNRMNLTPEQRRDTYPFAIGRYGYEDIPKNEQIITFGNNKANAQRPLTEFEQAHATAQRNAALPVNQGGLGLAADNTAMDRARAMGFDAEAYHGTNTGFDEFNASGWSSTSPSYADNIASRKSAIYGGNEVNMPLLVNNTNAMYVNSQRAPSSIIEEAANSGYSGVVGDGFYINSPKNIRSRFAAFDPFNRESSNLLATTAPLLPTTALGAYMYNEKRKKSQGNQ